MPIVLLAVGALFLIAGIRGKQDELFTLLKGDFTGQDNFFVWAFALAFIWAFSYIPGFKPVANAFFALVIIVLLFSHADAIQKLAQAVQSTTSVQPQSTPTTGDSSTQVVDNSGSPFGVIDPSQFEGAFSSFSTLQGIQL